MNILIIRLSSLGDIVHTYPMINDIKSNFPNAEIDWLVDNSFQDLIKINPHINNIITIPLRLWIKNKFSLIPNIICWKKAIRTKFATKHYDYIIDSQGLLKSAILAKNFNGTVSGFGKNSIKEKIATLFYTNKIETGKEHLAIQKNRLLAAKILNYTIDQTQVNFGISNSIPESNNKTVIFFHATSKDSKKYSIANWVKLAQYLITKHNCQIIIPFGSDQEQKESNEIKSLLSIYPNMVLVPEQKMNYPDLTKLIQSAFFVFGVDTGLIHLSNALNKKLIAIYTDTDPKKTGVFETTKAKNIGNRNEIPAVTDVINLFEIILKA